MKKIILVIALLASATVKAGGSDIGSGYNPPAKARTFNLSAKCRCSMIRANEHRLFVEKGIQAGEITPETSEFFLKSVNEVVGNAALTCVGLKNIELENSFASRIGLLSQERADELSADVYEEAIEFYESLKTK